MQRGTKTTQSVFSPSVNRGRTDLINKMMLSYTRRLSLSLSLSLSLLKMVFVIVPPLYIMIFLIFELRITAIFFSQIGLATKNK